MAGRTDLQVAIARRPEGPVSVRVERTVEADWAGDPLAAAALMLGPLPLRVVDVDDNVRDAAAHEVRRAWRSLAAAQAGRR